MSKKPLSWTWLVVPALLFASIPPVVQSIRDSTDLWDSVGGVLWGLLPIVFATTAAMIITQHRTNPIGWLLMIPALSVIIGIPVSVWLNGFEVAPPEVTLGILAAAWFDNISWMLLIFPLFHLLLVFPSGRIPTARWAWFVYLEVSMISFLGFLAVFSEEIGTSEGKWTARNPIGFISQDFFEEGLFSPLWTASLMLLTFAAVTALVRRFRRADPVERTQIRWLLFAVAIFGLVYATTAITTEDWGGWDIIGFFLPVSIVGIPIAIAVAILKYRLFEIDRLISRAVGYTLVLGILGLTYGVGAVWLPTIFSQGKQSAVFTAGSTLAVAALFNPVRSRLIKRVDRRFYRTRFDAEQLAERFSLLLRAQVDLSSISNTWLTAVEETLRPEGLGLWLRGIDPVTISERYESRY